MLRIGDRCTVNVDWGNKTFLRNKRAQVVKIQQHGTQTFVKIFWIGKYAQKLEDEFGLLFEIEDLKRIEVNYD